MSSFNLPRRALLVTAALAAATALAGCGFTPAYTDQGAASARALNFAAANNPLEQLVYQDLSTRFGQATTPDAPSVSVVVTTYSRDLGQSATSDPAAGHLLTASGVLRITQNGNPILTTTRQATATYTSDSQVLADNSAEIAAQNQAAHALAQTLELTIISALTPKQTASQ